jgi:hypothetical protein
MQLTNLQLELLKTFHYQLNETPIVEINRLLSKYFAEKTTSEIDKFYNENNWNEQTIEDLSNEHMRVADKPNYN